MMNNTKIKDPFKPSEVTPESKALFREIYVTHMKRW